MKAVLIVLMVINALAYQKPRFDVRHWKQWHRLNKEILDSEAHAAMVDVYVNDKARAVYENATAPYPVGAMVVKPLYADKDRKECARIVVMVKMPAGYDTKNGDWWYGVGDESGEAMYYQGVLRSCIACHKAVEETDYMFSQSVMAKIKGLAEEMATPLPDHSLVD